MITTRTPRFRSAVAAATIVATGGLVAPTAVDAAATEPATDEPAAADAEIRPRLERACKRIPNLQIRTGNLLERLQGDAETRGSLAWLEVQIGRAEEAGREQLVTVLENRLEVRTAFIPVLELRIEGLADLEAFCADNGVEL